MDTDFEKFHSRIHLSPRYVRNRPFNSSWFEYGGFATIKSVFLNSATVKKVQNMFSKWRPRRPVVLSNPLHEHSFLINATRFIFRPGQIAHCARLANAPPSGPAWLLVAQMQGFPTHGVFLNPDRQPKGSTRPNFCVEREYGIRIGAWARENAILAHSRKTVPL